MEKTNTLLKTSKLELLKALTDKIKGFSPKEAVEGLEKRFNGLSKNKRGLLGVALILLGGSLITYSLNNAAQTSKAHWQELKASKASKLHLNKTLSEQPNSANETLKPEWQPINHMLASTPARRAKALESIDFPKSEGVIIGLSLHCPECIKVAVDINPSVQKDKLSSVIGVAVASEAETKAWKERLNLDYEVKSISEADMENLGVALFPTLIKVSNTSTNPQKPKYEITASAEDVRVVISNTNNPYGIGKIVSTSNVRHLNSDNNKK